MPRSGPPSWSDSACAYQVHCDWRANADMGRIELWLRTGRFIELRHWLATQPVLPEPCNHFLQLDGLNRVRAALGLGKHHLALRWLERLQAAVMGANSSSTRAISNSTAYWPCRGWVGSPRPWPACVNCCSRIEQAGVCRVAVCLMANPCCRCCDSCRPSQPRP